MNTATTHAATPDRSAITMLGGTAFTFITLISMAMAAVPAAVSMMM